MTWWTLYLIIKVTNVKVNVSGQHTIRMYKNYCVLVSTEALLLLRMIVKVGEKISPDTLKRKMKKNLISQKLRQW